MSDTAPRVGTRSGSTGAGEADKESGGLPELGALVGNYRLLEVIGTGGMGRVYKAEHTVLGKKVALKMLRRRYAQNPEAVQRFFSEARAVTRIEHDNLVDVTDFVETEEWPPCFVMQLLRGENLAHAIRETGPFPVPRLFSVGIQTASAVGAVHAASIIHRDLKPANIFLAQHRGGGEVVKLLDFGVAKLLDEQGISMNDTNAGVPVGTPDYMAPEQVTGSARVDFRVDMWALGAVLYEAATGRLPFKANSFGELVLALLSKDAVPPNELRTEQEPLPAPLERLILQCLNRVPAQRPSSMQELYERLHAMATPYAIPFLDGNAFPLVETDPGMLARTGDPSRPALATAPPPAAAAEGDDELAAGGPPTAAPSDASPRARGRAPLYAAALAALGVIAVVAWPAGERDAPVEVSGTREAVAAPERVTLTFVSTPAGAQVFYQGEDDALGVTPLELEVPRGEEVLQFELRLEGYVSLPTLVSPDQTQRIESALAPASAPERATERGRRDGARREGPATGAPTKPATPKDKEGLLPVF